jgi:hypothetical protein
VEKRKIAEVEVVAKNKKSISVIVCAEQEKLPCKLFTCGIVFVLECGFALTRAFR